jgi:aspartate kinase
MRNRLPTWDDSQAISFRRIFHGAYFSSHFFATFLSPKREGFMKGSLPRPGQIVVVKLGGSILVRSKAYKRAAKFLSNRLRKHPDERLVVVVSAQEGTTDKLERAARKIVSKPQAAALDLLWSTGEIRSVAVLALELEGLGVRAAALNIHQAGLRVSKDRNRKSDSATTVECGPEKLFSVLEKFPVAIVPGFFATDSEGAIASLGRGGSDLTAVLLATGLQACRCELVKDVPGYFTSDPHRHTDARPIQELTFERALEFADSGCDLVQRKAIEAAQRSRLPLIVRSLNENEPASRIVETKGDECRTNEISSAVEAF